MDTKAIEQNRKDDYKTGLNWPDAWETHGEPGGPWVYSNRLKNPDLFDQLFAENKAWREGWAAGHAVKLARKEN